MALPRTNPITRVIKDLMHLGLEAFGKYYSSYRGFVVDRNDPLGLGRLQLLIPQVTGNNPYKYWALPKGVYSGEGYGSQVIPQNGDLVWVEFEGGCPEVPIWNHGHFGMGEMPTDAELQDKNTYWFLSPQGNLLLANDTKKLIRIKTPAGDLVEINGNSISLVTSKKISLGQLDGSAEPAVLGNQLVTTLQSLIKILGNAKVLTSIGLQPLQADTQMDLKLLNIELNKILSKKVTLD